MPLTGPRRISRWGGHAVDAYNNAVIEAFERAHTRMDEKGYLAFYYPPQYLLLCLPLGLLPYVPALLAFLAVQAAVLWRVLTLILRPAWGVLPILAYPGFLMNFLSGQNGGFSAACFGAGLLWLESRPALAGVCLGFLVCKPQIALAVPVALFAARRWRAALFAAATGAALCGASWLALGSAPWVGFFANAPAARADLETLPFKWPMMQSLYAEIRLAGGDLALGYAGQALLAAVALALLVRICWRRRGRGRRWRRCA
ncbi:MAG: glycosyltransferase family 87 protein [Rhodospirillales bacterium]